MYKAIELEQTKKHYKAYENEDKTPFLHIIIIQ